MKWWHTSMWPFTSAQIDCTLIVGKKCCWLFTHSHLMTQTPQPDCLLFCVCQRHVLPFCLKQSHRRLLSRFSDHCTTLILKHPAFNQPPVLECWSPIRVWESLQISLRECSKSQPKMSCGGKIAQEMFCSFLVIWTWLWKELREPFHSKLDFGTRAICHPFQHPYKLQVRLACDSRVVISIQLRETCVTRASGVVSKRKSSILDDGILKALWYCMEEFSGGMVAEWTLKEGWDEVGIIWNPTSQLHTTVAPLEMKS